MEGDAGTGPLNPADAVDASSPETVADQPSSEQSAGDPPDLPDSPDLPAGQSRLGRGWVLGVCAALLLLTAGLGVGGYYGLRYHRESRQIESDNAAAVAAAKDCVVATQAPDVADINAAERKIFECSTGEFRTQYTLYSGVYVQAYRAAGVKVGVSELRAAVERDNDDGSVDVLVALRIKADNVEAKGREYGYRLRAQMAREDGQYRIAKLDQVAR